MGIKRKNKHQFPRVSLLFNEEGLRGASSVSLTGSAPAVNLWARRSMTRAAVLLKECWTAENKKRCSSKNRCHMWGTWLSNCPMQSHICPNSPTSVLHRHRRNVTVFIGILKSSSYTSSRSKQNLEKKPTFIWIWRQRIKHFSWDFGFYTTQIFFKWILFLWKRNIIIHIFILTLMHWTVLIRYLCSRINYGIHCMHLNFRNCFKSTLVRNGDRLLHQSFGQQTCKICSPFSVRTASSLKPSPVKSKYITDSTGLLKLRLHCSLNCPLSSFPTGWNL